MLWKPITPVYPRLVKRAPEGLTLEEASELRKKGRELIPIRKLGILLLFSKGQVHEVGIATFSHYVCIS